MKKCNIRWCDDLADSEGGWCWTHLVFAHIDHVPMSTKDAKRVEQAFEEDRRWARAHSSIR